MAGYGASSLRERAAGLLRHLRRAIGEASIRDRCSISAQLDYALGDPVRQRFYWTAHDPLALQAAGHRSASRSSGEENGRERDTGARINLGPQPGKARGRLKAPDVCARYVSHPRPPHNLTAPTNGDHQSPAPSIANTRATARRPRPARRTRAPPSDPKPRATPHRQSDAPKSRTPALDFHRSGKAAALAHARRALLDLGL